MAAALLWCSSLRRLQVADCWLSSSVAAAASPALPHPQRLHIDVVWVVDEARLAVLLDAAPHLEELHLHSQELPYDVLLWVGARCHQLRGFTITERDYAEVEMDFPVVTTVERWQALPAAPALPLLSTPVLFPLPLDAFPSGLTTLFTLLTAYLAHSTPRLRHLWLVDFDWPEHERALLSSSMQALTALRGLRLGWTGWMQLGLLKRYWVHTGWKGATHGEKRSSTATRVRREERTEDGDAVWGPVDGLSMPACAWEVEDIERTELRAVGGVRERLRGGAREQEEVWTE